LPDDEAKDAYAALVSIVHQMARQEAGLGMPVALDEVEVFARSFEAYVDHLDELDPNKLETHYEIMLHSALNEANPPKLRFGAQALMVVRPAQIAAVATKKMAAGQTGANEWLVNARLHFTCTWR
jgi:hypothetical protein